MAPNDMAENAESADTQESVTPTAAEAPVKEKKPRSKLERNIVRGGILILFIVMLLELYASRRFNSDFAAAHEALGTGPVTESDVKRLITHYSSVESNPDLTANLLVATREDKYSYRGLLKNRVMYVYYGVVLKHEKEADVLDVKTEPTEFFDFKKKPFSSPAPVAEESVAEESVAEESVAEEPVAEEPGKKVKLDGTSLP